MRNEITVRNDEADPTDNNQLVAQNIWGQMASPEPVADQIVHLKAEYGMDDGKNNGTVERAVHMADDGMVDNFTTVSPDVTNRSSGAGCAACAWRSSRAASRRTARLATPRPTTTPTFADTYPVRWARGPDAPEWAADRRAHHGRLAVLPLPRLRDHGTAAQHDLEAGMKALRNRMRLPLCRRDQRGVVLFIALDRAGGHDPGRHRDHALGGHRQPDRGQRRLQAGHARRPPTAASTMAFKYLKNNVLTTCSRRTSRPKGSSRPPPTRPTTIGATTRVWGDAKVVGTDAAGNTISYVIHRMCDAAGQATRP